MQDFTEKLCGDLADVRLLVPPGTEPHDWEPTPRNMTNMAAADLIVVNGLGMEGWLDKIRGSLKDVPFAVLTDGFAVTHDEAAHDHGHGHNDGDPHVWLNPLYAAAQMRVLCDALCAIDPDHAAVYEANYAAFAEEAAALDAEYHAALSDMPQKNIVVAHEAYGYLCDAYGLTQTAVEGLSADGDPSPAQITNIIKFIRDNRITHVFFEELVPSKALNLIAEQTGAQMLLLSPLEILGEGEDYFSVMRANLENLSKR